MKAVSEEIRETLAAKHGKIFLRTMKDIQSFLNAWGVRDAVIHEYTGTGYTWGNYIGWKKNERPLIVVRCYAVDIPLADKLRTHASLPVGVEVQIKELGWWERPYKLEVRHH